MYTKKISIALTIIIVLGIGAYFGINYYNEYQLNKNREEIKIMLGTLGKLAQEYALNKSLETGEKEFTGWNMPASFKETQVGQFKFRTWQNEVRLLGIGKIKGRDELSNIQISAIVKFDNISYRIRN